MSAASTHRLVGFDGLRALAAVLVIAYHAGSLSHASLSGRLAPVVAELKGGVVVFFVVSGFLLYLPFARAIRDGRGLPRWQEFAGRRAVRILPAYWVALALLAGVGLVHGVLTQSWWRYFGLAQIYAPSSLHHGLDVAWSLCTEITLLRAVAGAGLDPGADDPLWGRRGLAGSCGRSPAWCLPR